MFTYEICPLLIYVFLSSRHILNHSYKWSYAKAHRNMWTITVLYTIYSGQVNVSKIHHHTSQLLIGKSKFGLDFSEHNALMLSNCDPPVEEQIILLQFGFLQRVTQLIVIIFVKMKIKIKNTVTLWDNGYYISWVII